MEQDIHLKLHMDIRRPKPRKVQLQVQVERKQQDLEKQQAKIPETNMDNH